MFTLEGHADVSKIMAGLGQVGITAAEAGDAMRKMVRLLNKDNNTWTYIADSIDQIGEKLNHIERELNLLRPETPSTTESSNQKEPFDFLEQNAYNSIQDIFGGERVEKITPLDFEEKF